MSDNADTTQIKTLPTKDTVNYPDIGTLIEQVVYLLGTDMVFSDIIIHQNSPLMLRQPDGLVAVVDTPVTKEDLEEFFEVVEPSWKERISKRAFDRAVDLHTSRIRANCFTFQGQKRLGCVIRRFPKTPLPLASIGLRMAEQDFARLTSGLVLVVGDTSQGKSTTIASMIDEINKTRSGHILTIEDPVEILIPHRKCIITQREVGQDGDVESFYLGALDALRERPDVIVIGEIRDSQTAIEALALAESGPLVFASIHARSTELGLLKMLRLLGNSPAQTQAFAHALRGVLCQALLPAVTGEKYYLATECLTTNPEITRRIEAGDISKLRDLMDRGTGPDSAGCHSMNSALINLMREKLIRKADAEHATHDRLNFKTECFKAMIQD